MRKITCWKIPIHKSGIFRQKTGNRRKRSVKHHADSDRKFRKPISFSKNTVTNESDRKISKSVFEIPKNSKTVFNPIYTEHTRLAKSSMGTVHEVAAACRSYYQAGPTRTTCVVPSFLPRVVIVSLPDPDLVLELELGDLLILPLQCLVHAGNHLCEALLVALHSRQDLLDGPFDEDATNHPVAAL
jgi:hypothetical protein